MIRPSLKVIFILTCLLIFNANRAFSVIATEPLVQSGGISAIAGSCSEIDLAFIPGDGFRRIIVAHAELPVDAFPIDGTGYTAGSLFGSGSNLGNNNFVVYNGFGNSTTITGLDGGTEYHFSIFEFNGTGTNSNYLIVGYPSDDAIAPGFTMSLSSSSGDMCIGDSVRLEVHGAENYQWSPAGGLSSTTDSVIYAKPSSTTNYTVQGSDISGCTDSKSISLTVYQLPNVNIGSFSNRCENTAIVNLTSGTPAGGQYSGNGVTGTQFNPSVAGPGQHTIVYQYSGIHGCSSSDSSTITILAAPTASFSSLSDVCVSQPQFALTGGSPAGGTYSGPGVSSGQFSPSLAGVGNFTILYIYSSGGCSDTASSTQRVRGLPNVSFATLSPVCLNSTPFTLSGGSPVGGEYTGSGVSNSQFSPLVSGTGTYVITYTYTDANSCSSSDTSRIIVNTIPSVSLSALPTVCQNTGPVTLNGGTPAGGTYSGPGVGGTTFYSGIAGPGAHSINYSYTNSNGCSNTATQTLTVNAAPNPNLGPDQTLCRSGVAILDPGIFSSYLWSTGANTQTISVDTTGRGLGTFMFTVSVASGANCVNKDTVIITWDNCSSIDQISEKENFIVYPNPANSSFHIKVNAASDILIYDIKGTIVKEIHNVSSEALFGDELSAGSYIVAVKQNGLFSYKLLIKN